MTQTTQGHGQTADAEHDRGKRRARDPRGYYRTALAVVAPLPFAAMGGIYLIQPAPAGAEFEETYAAVLENPGNQALMTALGWVFFALLIPAVLAVGAVTWRRVPRVTAIAVTWCVPAFAAAFGILGPGADRLARLGEEVGIPVDSLAALDTALWEEPITLVAGLMFIMGIVIGVGMLGVALWRSRLAPAWMGIALALAGATHPFLPNNLTQGIGLLVGAVGFAGASLALLRMTNDEFVARRGAQTTEEG